MVFVYFERSNKKSRNSSVFRSSMVHGMFNKFLFNKQLTELYITILRHKPVAISTVWNRTIAMKDQNFLTSKTKKLPHFFSEVGG